MASNTRRATYYRGYTKRDNTGGVIPSTSDNTDGVRITGAVHDEYLAGLAAREDSSSLSDVLGGIVDDQLMGRLSRGQRAARIWLAANGDLERRHTCGVYVRDARLAGADPVVGVYVDSSARLTDFRANKDLYLSRLSNAGLAVSDIEFRLSRSRRPLVAEEKGKTDGHAARVPNAAVRPLPPLTPAEEQRVAALSADLPDGLRQSVSRAISLSMRREKSADTRRQ